MTPIQHILQPIQMAMDMVRGNFPFVLHILALLWLIHAVNWLTGYRLNILGIQPRRLFGLPGIIFSPFLHVDFNHLFFNSIPLFVLSSFVLIGGHTQFFILSTIIILLGGFGIWCFARRAIHVGASGLITGYFGYLLVAAYREPSILTVALITVCLYYFGGLLTGLIPSEKAISWEGHLCGFLAGIASMYLYPWIVSLLPQLAT